MKTEYLGCDRHFNQYYLLNALKGLHVMRKLDLPNLHQVKVQRRQAAQEKAIMLQQRAVKNATRLAAVAAAKKQLAEEASIPLCINIKYIICVRPRSSWQRRPVFL